MHTITLHAHFDGKQILLDEPMTLEPDTKLIVTVLPKLSEWDEHDHWLSLSKNKLKDAYSNNEPEYSSDLIKESNPESCFSRLRHKHADGQICQRF